MLLRGHLVLSICLAILSLSAKAADISMRLEHDIETNPGPSSFCQGVRTRTNYIINLGRRGSLADLSKSCGLFLGWLSRSWNTWSPSWSSQSKHQPGSSWKTLCWLDFCLWWRSTLHKVPFDSNHSFHGQRVSKCQKWRANNSPSLAKSSRRHQLGRLDKTLHCRKTWRNDSRYLGH